MSTTLRGDDAAPPAPGPRPPTAGGPPRAGSPRRARLALRASDPGLGRLRSALRTIATIAVAAGAVVGAALLVGVPVAPAVPGLIVAFVASFAVRDATAGGRAVTMAWMAVAASVAATLSAAVGALSPVGVVVFVGVGVTAVFLQRLGPRGLAPGMAAFITYLITAFLGVGLGNVPITAAAAVLGAAVTFAAQQALADRHPEREVRHVLAALEIRAAGTLESLAAVRRTDGSAREGRRARRRLHRRLAATRRTAGTAEDRLGEVDDRVDPAIDNEALGARVFDLRLGLEHLAALVDDDRVGRGSALPATAGDDAALLDVAAGALLMPVDDPDRWAAVDARTGADAGDPRLRRALRRVLEEWRRPAERLPAVPDDRDDDGVGADEDRTGEDRTGEDRTGEDRTGEDRTGEGRTDEDREDGDGDDPPIRDTVRRAVQVAIAVAASVAVGELISPTRWFWAVITAFVVFVGSSSRGDVLTKGWQRTVGTLGGAFVGVGAATLVAGRPAVSLVLIVVCLFLALYLMSVSSGALMFFVTVVLALAFGLVGQFTVTLLVVRLAETAAGAAIGIAVSFLVLPTRTRTTVADATADFLDEVRDVVEEAVGALVGSGRDGTAVEAVGDGTPRELRTAYDAVVTAATPLTDGVAGALDRSSYRDALAVAGSCDHHARLLLRLARRHGGLLDDTTPGTAGEDAGGLAGDVAAAVREAGEHVRARVDAVARRLGRDGDPDRSPEGDGDEDPFARLDDVVHRLTGDRRQASAGLSVEAVEAVGTQLRAIDRAMTDLVGDPRERRTFSRPGR